MSYLKYTGLALQMGGTIAIFAYLGYYLDKKVMNQTPYFTVFLSLFAVIGSIVKLIIDLNNENKKS